MIRNLVGVLQKKNPIVKWEDDPSGLKDDWTLYYISLTSNDVYKVVHPFYKQLDEMECAHLHKCQRNGDSSASEYDHDPSASDEDNSVQRMRTTATPMRIMPPKILIQRMRTTATPTITMNLVDIPQAVLHSLMMMLVLMKIVCLVLTSTHSQFLIVIMNFQ
jgi:hypothetical protein